VTQRLAEAERRTRDLHGDLQHRVRGFMAVIGAAVRHSAETTSGFEDHASHLDGRIGAILRAQLMALRAPSGTVDLHHLVAEELLAHAAVEGPQLSISGPSIRLAGRAVGILWLAVHELSVNAVKFGALATRDGHITVAWRLHSNGTTSVNLRWIERQGPPMLTERRIGFGTEIIERRLARELGGTGAISFTPTGLECRISLPVSDEVRVDETAG